jgi:hypothetical protein
MRVARAERAMALAMGSLVRSLRAVYQAPISCHEAERPAYGQASVLVIPEGAGLVKAGFVLG